MQQLALLAGAIFGFSAIVLGAFGAHAFKKIISAEKLISFEVGVRYQMYAALSLLIMGFNLEFDQSGHQTAVVCMIAGTILFSFSIYFLSFAEYWNKNLKFLGPITPIGGLLMLISWGILIVSFL